MNPILLSLRAESFSKNSIKISHMSIKPILLCLIFLHCGGCQNNENIERESDRKLTTTEEKKIEEITNSMNEKKKYPSVPLNSQFSFQLSPKKFEQFYINLPEENPIILMATIYLHLEQTDTYVEINAIDEIPPIQMTVYENNNKIIGEGFFYFKGTIVIDGKKGATYHLRFYTTGKWKKLVIIDHNPILESWDFDGLMKEHQVEKYLLKQKQISNKIEFALKQLRTYQMFSSRDDRQFESLVEKYKNFQITEMVLVVGVCFLQIKVIGKLLKPTLII